VELLEQAVTSPVDPYANKDDLVSIAMSMVREDIFALPTFQKGVGPFPRNTGRWIRRPSDQLGRRAVAGLYLALVANVSLDLIGDKETLVIEGRFADDPVFTGALATLRRHQRVYLSDASNSLPYGALRLIDPTLPSQAVLRRVEPLGCDLAGYAAAWRSMTQTAEAAA
jgi:hypothetical protein